ncbi:hypothetical protein BDZ89DRAFT_1162903 [Hymenopellis radicata]|nr:hypothetical protein BDZ89DRAFT_1162903 [Hymenopellis radicata]
MTSPTMTCDTLLEDRRKRPQSLCIDYSATLDALSDLQDQLESLPDVADEDMLRQLARLSRKLRRHWQPRPEPSQPKRMIADPLEGALFDLESMYTLQFRTENMKALSDQSRALGNKHAFSSEWFNGALTSLKSNLLASSRSAHCWVELYLYRVVGMFSESHPNHTLVIRPGYESTTHEITPTRSTSMKLYVLCLCPLAHAHAHQIIANEDAIPHFRGFLVIYMDFLDLHQATLELAKFAKKSQSRTLRGVATDGLQWEAMSVTWDELFLYGHSHSGVIRSYDLISSPDFVVGVVHHWVKNFCVEVGTDDEGYFKISKWE